MSRIHMHLGQHNILYTHLQGKMLCHTVPLITKEVTGVANPFMQTDRIAGVDKE